MSTWTPAEWTTFFLAAGAFLTAAVTPAIINIILTLRGNAKTDRAAVISADNNTKLSAVVHQTNEIASVTPGASTAPTDTVLNKETKS